MQLRKSLPALALAAAAIAAPVCAQDPPPAAKPASAQKRPDIYDVNADGQALVAGALAKGKRDHKNVLVMFGGNWCGWCHLLHDVFKKNSNVATTLRNEYEVVMLDTGRTENKALAKQWGSAVSSVPYLVVLDDAGKVVVNQPTEPLEDGDHHDPARVLEFLKKHAPQPLVASDVLAAAREKARASGRRTFVHIGAPWCGRCHKLEDFLARPEIEAIVAKDLVEVKIDQDRMTGGMELATALRKGTEGGIPWFVFEEPDGTAVVTSDAPAGNIGYPAKPEEIAHFMTMLEKVKKNITVAELAIVKDALEAAEKGRALQPLHPGPTRLDAPAPVAPAAPGTGR